MPILPIVLEGTGNALPKRGFVLQGRHPIHIRVLPPLPYASFADKPAVQLTEEMRALYLRELDEDRTALSA